MLWISGQRTYADVYWRILTYAVDIVSKDVCWCILTYTDVCCGYRVKGPPARRPWAQVLWHHPSYCYICVLILLYVSAHYCILLYPERTAGLPCILLYTSPHTTIYVSEYYYIRLRILLYVFPHTIIYVSSYHYTCVLTTTYGATIYDYLWDRYMCLHTAVRPKQGVSARLER